MSFFSVAHIDNVPNFEILICHLNLWSLRGLCRRAFFFDVGLQLKVTKDHTLKSFYLTLPFVTRDKVVSDLSSEFTTKKNAEIIFGGNVTTNNNEVTYANITYKTVPILPNSCKIEKDYSEKDSSCWKIELENDAKSEEEIYIRFRLEVLNLDKIWIIKSQRNGFIIDFRVCDLRESPPPRDGRPNSNFNKLKSKIIPINNLYVYFILPIDYSLKATNPDLRYMRLLEGKVWEDYLQRRTNRFGLEKLPIYSWGYHSQAGATPQAGATSQAGVTLQPGVIPQAGVTHPPISTSVPFRIYADFLQDNKVNILNRLVLFVFAVLAVIIGNQIPESIPLVSSKISELIAFIKVNFKHNWVITTIGICTIPKIVEMVSKIGQSFFKIKKLIQFLNIIARNIENFYYKK